MFPHIALLDSPTGLAASIFLLTFAYEDGRLRRKPISVLEVPFWKARVKKRKTYYCKLRGVKFASYEGLDCPRCGLPSNDL